jgi:hypothetical protein
MSKHLLPEKVARQDGASAAMTLEGACGKPLLVTLGITRSVEQESLEISLWGSPDNRNWKHLQTFPQKFYCGTYSMLLDLSRWRDVKYIRAEWRMQRWGCAETTPMFGFYLEAQEAKLQAAGA